jgi:hypothetical protein
MHPSPNSIHIPSHVGKSIGHAVLHFALPDDVRTFNPERYDTIRERVPTGLPGTIASSVFDSNSKQSLGHDKFDDDTVVPPMSENLARSCQEEDEGQDDDSTVRANTVRSR